MEYGVAVVWFLGCHAVAFLGLPVANWLFGDFPHRGAAFSFPVAIVVVTLVSYWVGHVAFGRLALVVGVFALVLVSVGFVFVTGAASRLGDYAAPALVFSLVFAIVVAVRAVDPAVYAHSGEMFLNFGLLKSLERSSTLPPADVWFAGEAVRYYYGGHLMSTLLSRLSGTPVRYAFNLHLATVVATLATAAYGLAGAIAAGHGLSHRLAGGLGVFFTTVASNVFGAVQLVLRSLPESVARDAAILLEFDPALSTTAQFRYTHASGFRPHFAPLDFPLYSTFHGDIHPHVMSAPFLLLVAAILYSATRATAPDRRRLLLLASAPVVGLVLFTNSWDFPTVCGLAFLTLALGSGHPRSLVPDWLYATRRPENSSRKAEHPARDTAPDGRLATRWYDEGTRLLWSFGAAATIGVLGIVLVAPYFGRMTSGFEPAVLPGRSGVAVLVLLHGAFLLVFAVYLFPRVRSSLDGLQNGDRNDRRLTLMGLGVVLLATAFVLDFPSLALYGPLVVAGWLLTRFGHDVGFEGVLLVAGAGLVVLVDLAYLDDPASIGRYNTVYKAYFQVWILWGSAAGVALARVLRDGPADEGSGRRLLRGRHLRVGFAVVLVLTLSVWGVVVATNHFTGQTPVYGPLYHQTDDPTLDALQPESEHHPAEMAAIQRLDRVSGQPHVVSAVGDNPYEWGANPAASLTGLPTIAGWTHAANYHTEAEYAQRAADVRAIYSGDEAVRARLLRKYDVQYIYVGPTERDRYGDVPFERQRGISVAFQNGAVTIYAVDQTAL